MITALRDYLRYRRLGLSRRMAFGLSGLGTALLGLAVNLSPFAIVLAGYLYGVAAAQADTAAGDNRAAAKLSQQAEYIKSLEGMLAKCISRGSHAIIIGDEVWFCGATDSGIKTNG